MRLVSMETWSITTSIQGQVMKSTQTFGVILWPQNRVTVQHLKNNSCFLYRRVWKVCPNTFALKEICHLQYSIERNLPFTAQHSTAQHSTAQHSTAQHSTAQHSTAQHSTAQHSTAQHSTAQHSTAQHSTAQHSTAQHSTAQHSTAQQLHFKTIKPSSRGRPCM